MDPVSITAGCLGLITAITNLSLKATSFVRAVRQSRSDIDGVNRELASLNFVLELLIEDNQSESIPVSGNLGGHISGIVENCITVVKDVESTLQTFQETSLRTNISWAASGREDVAKLLRSIQAHNSALQLALDMVALSALKDVKSDTNAIRDDTDAIRHDTAQILDEISKLQAKLPHNSQNSTILEQHLENMTSYTEAELQTPDIPAIASTPNNRLPMSSRQTTVEVRDNQGQTNYVQIPANPTNNQMDTVIPNPT